MSSRPVFLAALGAVAGAVALPGLRAEAGASAGQFGSGGLDPWSGMLKAITPDSKIRATLAADGVFTFGDSIARQDSVPLASEVYNRLGLLMAVNYWNGRPAGPAVDALAQWAATYGLPSRVLMATGSNDIYNPPAFRAQVDRAMSIAGPDRRVVWVNVHVSRWRYSTSVQVADQRNSGWINIQLAQAAAVHPNLVVVDWARLLADYPFYRIPNYLSDGVHTSVPAGQAARNAMIVQALA